MCRILHKSDFSPSPPFNIAYITNTKSYFLIIRNFNCKSVAVHLQDGSLFPSRAHLPPAMVQNIKITAKRRENKHYSILWKCVHSARHMRTGKMQLPAFIGHVDLCITYFRCFTLVLSVNIVYVGYFFVSMDLHMLDLLKSGCVSVM
jgi:hypothetical protein